MGTASRRKRNARGSIRMSAGNGQSQETQKSNFMPALAVFCWPCCIVSKKIGMWNEEHPDEAPKEVPDATLAVTWELSQDQRGMPFGPYPVCANCLKVPATESNLLVG